MKNNFLLVIKMLSIYSIVGIVLQAFLLNFILAGDNIAQELKSVKEVYVSMDIHNASLETTFKIIESSTNFKFAYEKEDLDRNVRINLRVKNQTLESVLLEISRVSSLQFRQVNHGIDVKKADKAIGVAKEIEVLIQTTRITGRVTSSDSPDGLPGVNVIEGGTNNGTVTNVSGAYSLDVSSGATLVFSSVGYIREEIEVGNRSVIDLVMTQDIHQLEELVVVGYGMQKKSDITGSVASVSQERLEMVPNVNIAQAIQGSIPGVMIETSSAGAAPNEVILVRGRNSILASNHPLIVVDGIPYDGQINNINPNDVKSIEILKDASAAAIYGSRGSNGVILITTKEGASGKPVFSYDGKYSFQRPSNLPDVMDGGEFFNFKMDRRPQHMTDYERQNYESNTWIDWYDLALRNGKSQEHNLSISGGSENIKYYISGGLLDIQGLAVKDDYLRALSRINLDVKFTNWLSIGTRTQMSFSDQSGIPADFDDILKANPLTTPFDSDGNLTIYPWPGNEDHVNSLERTIWDNTNNSYQVITNNFAVIDFPFAPGLRYRINTGVNVTYLDDATYIGRNSTTGFKLEGGSETERSFLRNTAVENIFSYVKDIGVHNIFATAVFSYEKSKFESTQIEAQGFPHDFLTNYSVSQAQLILPNYSFLSTHLISQMLRINYAYDSRYLLTLTGRRDGFSGFGSESKWGLFPSIALGWNLANEDFFRNELFSTFKLRVSLGLNGNQAVGAYESISRLREFNMVDAKKTVPGYEPSKLGQDNLSWESSRTLNVGLDFGLMDNRLSGDINVFNTNTSDLLLNRTISGVHGITQITQNIGKTESSGFEFSITSRNISKKDFFWLTSANVSYLKNKIVSLYGDLDEQGREIDDVANAWFIGKPVRVNYDFEWLGTWQLDEEAEATIWGTKPGYVKLRDVNGDDVLNGDDRVIIGQRDPKYLWGMNNSVSFKGLTFNIFLHGVHGITKWNSIMTDRNTQNEIRRNTIKKDWWTPENPTNKFVMNHADAEFMSGQLGRYYQDASFVRVKDMSVSYDFPLSLVERIKLKRTRIYVAGRNLFTISSWDEGMDPELQNQNDIPLQKEVVLGLNIEF